MLKKGDLDDNYTSMLSNITPKRHALLNGKIITQGVGYLPMSYWSWRHQKSSKYHRL